MDGGYKSNLPVYPRDTGFILLILKLLENAIIMASC